jgi:hypothetical protein
MMMCSSRNNQSKYHMKTLRYLSVGLLALTLSLSTFAAPGKSVDSTTGVRSGTNGKTTTTTTTDPVAMSTSSDVVLSDVNLKARLGSRYTINTSTNAVPNYTFTGFLLPDGRVAGNCWRLEMNPITKMSQGTYQWISTNGVNTIRQNFNLYVATDTTAPDVSLTSELTSAVSEFSFSVSGRSTTAVVITVQGTNGLTDPFITVVDAAGNAVGGSFTLGESRWALPDTAAWGYVWNEEVVRWQWAQAFNGECPLVNGDGILVMNLPAGDYTVAVSSKTGQVGTFTLNMADYR